MHELLNRLSPYNLFNFLLSGALFYIFSGIMADKVPSSVEGIFIAFFLFYFFGLVVSSFGSLVVEPILKRMSLVKSACGNDSAAISSEDKQIRRFIVTSNIYSTLCSLFFLLVLYKVYSFIRSEFSWFESWDVAICFVLLLVLFLFSLRKQADNIAKRVGGESERRA
jgi:hypothetical protein